MLEEDAARFDTFLKENDERVQAALRKADAEARGKQEKARASHAGCQGLKPCNGAGPCNRAASHTCCDV